MCQLAGLQVSKLSIISVFSDEISIWVGGLSKIGCSLQCLWASSNLLRLQIEEIEEGRTLSFFFLLDCLSWDKLFSCPWYSWLSDLQTQTGALSASLVLRPSDSILIIPLAFLALQLADSRLWDLTSIIVSQFLVQKTPLSHPSTVAFRLNILILINLNLVISKFHALCFLCSLRKNFCETENH